PTLSSYDHLDIQSLKAISEHSPNVQFLVSLELRDFLLKELGVSEDRIQEVDWWDAMSFPRVDGSQIEFVCTPAQHNSGGSSLRFYVS
ncbi:hypothetical protein RYX53_15815, partial [Alkalibacillus haloalkaliphilus]|nr:hypothetical protein [Alkalibacillus haloalkaliphilus]